MTRLGTHVIWVSAFTTIAADKVRKHFILLIVFKIEKFSFEIIMFYLKFFKSEKGDVKSKTEALKKVIIMILNGEKLPGLLMTIIRFVLPLQDHTIKKLLLVFWEIVPKTTPDGRLLHEMILVCDAYRKVN